MRNFKQTIINITTSFLMLLFCYAAVSKILDFENFQVQIAQSPLLSAYAGFVSYSVIIAELLIVALLMIPKARPAGLYASFGLMLAFTVYIYLILNYSDFVPCSCGGILEKMGWTEHLIFNTACVLLTLYAIMAQHKLKIEKSQIDEIKERRMLKRSRIWLATKLSIVTLLSSTLVISMFFSSEYIIKKENNFIRRFPHHLVIEDKVLNLTYNSYYFAGTSKGKVYLGNTSAPLLLTEIDTAFSRVNQKLVKIEEPLSYKSLKLSIKDDDFYLFDGNVPIIYQGKIKDLNTKIISHRDAYFSQLAIIDSTHFALRIQTTRARAYNLALLKLRPEPRLDIKAHILEKQFDGIFDVDGKLIVDSYNQNLIYTYFYRNQFIIMDKNLNITHRLNTIDTTKTAQIKIYQTKKGDRKFYNPPLQVNKNMTVYRQLLFISSNMKGKHEHQKEWNNSTIVDIYKTNQQEYIGSFYVQDRGKNKMSQMLITDRFLYVMVGSEMRRYRLAQSITKHF